MESALRSSIKKALIFLSVLGLSMLLTACQYLPTVANDPANECDHPAKPDKPYTDQSAGLLIDAQGQKIDVCRALLGHKGNEDAVKPLAGKGAFSWI